MDKDPAGDAGRERPPSPPGPPPVLREATVSVPVATSISAMTDRRKMEGKWGEVEDDDEDLVPPGCE